VVIEHIIGEMYVWVRYAHMERVDVKVGDAVTAGQRIGLYGNTGYSFGEHCHVDMWVALGDIERAAKIGFRRPRDLRIAMVGPGLLTSRQNVDPTEYLRSRGLDVINNGGQPA
jgi:murein DD-endopeptidase MepM/ murein hydrolase activator NlpD